MLARQLRLILAMEALLYSLVAWMLLESGILGVGGTLAAIALLALTGRAIYLGTAFVVAAAADDGTAPALGPFGTTRLLAGELAAFIWTHTLVQPFPSGFRRGLPTARNRGDMLPTVFVHGFCCNEGYWLLDRRALHRRGVVRQAGINLEPVFCSIDDYADPLRECIEAVCKRFGAPRVVIVAHSMGGLAARAYARRHGANRIAGLITVGTPHQGTALARLAMGRNARQMRPDCEWLHDLNTDPRTRGFPITTILSRHDEMVSPRASAMLHGARTVRLSGIGHLALGLSPAVRGHLYRAIAEQARAQ